MTHPKVSICMPIYNASRFLRESIDSVLSQTFADFEFLIADDGSTDNSVEIVESYNDARIRLIRRPHDYIATLNCLLDESRGRYIARMDADDIMLPSRLQLQVDYMDAHPDVDLLGTDVIPFSDSQQGHRTHLPEHISMVEMVDSCCVAHPTVIIRRESLDSMNLRYSDDFAYAEDYELWIRLLKNGGQIRNLNEPLLKYRVSESQVSTVQSVRQAGLSEQIRLDAVKWLVDKSYELINKKEEIPTSEKELTVIIPFLNEGEEVINTVKSVRENVDNYVEIIVINDNSTDGKDYEAELKPYGVRYYTNPLRIGAALAKERGVKLCPTPYFIILDAHMRCYGSDWAGEIVEILRENPNQLLCTNSRPLTKDEATGEVRSQKDELATYGAHMTFTHDRYLPFITWTTAGSIIPRLNNDEIPCIYGAGYASSRTYWQSLGGLKGLIHYGCEEQFISTKAWLEGGGCRLLPSIYMGHIYRDISTTPFSLVGILHIYNYLVICESLLPISTGCLGRAVLWQLARPQYFKALDVFRSVGQKHVAPFAGQQGGDFRFIFESNNTHHPADNVLDSVKKTESETVEQIVAYYSTVESPGVCNGLTAGIITLANYLTVNPTDENAKKLYSTLLLRLTDALETDDIEFRDGLSGIGWGLMYLMSNDFISKEYQKELLIIDQCISEYPLEEINKTAFFDGFGGILAYVATRLQFSVATNLPHNFSESFLLQLDSIIESILEETSDYLTYSFALQYSKRKDYLASNITAPRLEDIFMPLKVVPEYIENQLRGLNGYDGLFIKFLQFQKYEAEHL